MAVSGLVSVPPGVGWLDRALVQLSRAEGAVTVQGAGAWCVRQAMRGRGATGYWVRGGDAGAATVVGKRGGMA